MAGAGEVLPPSYGSGNERYGGFYTQQDVREIVDYAAFRNVEIIPEIDLPGHSQTLTSVYPETFCRTSGSVTYKPEEMRETLCAGREENFEMLRDISQELAGLFPSKYIHIGGDEVSVRYWRNCPRCRALMTEKKMKTPAELRGYFVHRLEDLVHSVGKTCAGLERGRSGPQFASGDADLRLGERRRMSAGRRGRTACRDDARFLLLH